MALDFRFGWLKLQKERESRITCTQQSGMISGIKLGAWHTQRNPCNSKQIGYYYSQLVNDKKVIQRTFHVTALLPFCFIIAFITMWHTNIRTYILFPYVQLTHRQKISWESHLCNKVISIIQCSSESEHFIISRFSEMLVHRYIS